VSSYELAPLYDAAALRVRDQSIAGALMQRLQQANLRLWWDQFVEAGQQFSIALMRRVFHESRSVIVLLSDQRASRSGCSKNCASQCD
jgi:hypothetical protein